MKPCDSRYQETAYPSLKEIAGGAAAEAERRAIRVALQATRGNKSEAARLLRVDYKTLHLKMKRYGIDGRAFLGVVTWRGNFDENSRPSSPDLGSS